MTEELLPKDISYQKLYEPEQNIWFLNWILKKCGFDSYLNQIILSMPFTVKRYYDRNGKLEILISFKNGQQHGLSREWYKNSQFWMEENWFCLERNWKNVQQHGLERGWYKGKIKFERNWQNGRKIYEKRC